METPRLQLRGEAEQSISIFRRWRASLAVSADGHQGDPQRLAARLRNSRHAALQSEVDVEATKNTATAPVPPALAEIPLAANHAAQLCHAVSLNDC